ncbi:class I SAM-dependent methyltransferase [Micromonospora inaquosa]|uniref:Class I SAM-dependent methyltransferase n=1 Tax=Micromonospora inaquosa TaxID=2203716 RepID=A0A3N9XBN5_9ACTN|nr:class I SAM-dependent methyltransferase [Micromonospora inaquosa]RQX04813.1 class I SAM-dependent methyltransferase [Micromonospora inaquosa]
MVDHTHALSFGAAASDYDRFRPRYPEAAVRWALDGLSRARVVDLAAGTGILTRAALTLGHHVVPVEPDPGMRAQLAAGTAGATALAGSAEAMPLPDSTADAVLVGTAYHWFDREPAHAEIARVLRPGGTFAPIWNIRDDSVDWVAELGRIAHFGDKSARLVAGEYPDFGPAFDAVEQREFTHRTTLTPAELLGMVRTRSYWLTAATGDQRQVERELSELLDTHPALVGRDTIDLPYRTLVLRARRR